MKFLFQPVQRVKIIFQVTGGKRFTFRDFYRTLCVHIPKKHGYKDLWKGYTATLYRQFPKSGIEWGVFDFTMSRLETDTETIK